MTKPSAPTGLVRTLGRWSLAALAINSVIGSGIFGLPSTVAGYLGPRSVIAVLIAGAAMAIIMGCFAEVASQFSEAGGPYLYARTAFGRLTGILVGWTLYLSQTAAPAANANLFVVYLAEFWPRVKEPWPRFLILTFLVWLLALINTRGARQGAVVSNVFTVAKILPLLLVILSGATLTLFHPAPWTGSQTYPAHAWMKAIFLLIFAYGGFESALAPTGETRNPARDTAFALIATAAVCTALYALVQWVVVGVLGSGATSERPLAEVARITLGNSGARLVAIGALSFRLWLSQRETPWHAPRHLRLGRGRRSPAHIRSRQPAFSHPVVFDSLFCRRCLGPGARRKFRLECDVVGSRAPFLLRSSLRRGDRVAPQKSRPPGDCAQQLPSASRAALVGDRSRRVCTAGNPNRLQQIVNPGLYCRCGCAELALGP